MKGVQVRAPSKLTCIPIVYQKQKIEVDGLSALSSELELLVVDTSQFENPDIHVGLGFCVTWIKSRTYSQYLDTSQVKIKQSLFSIPDDKEQNLRYVTVAERKYFRISMDYIEDNELVCLETGRERKGLVQLFSPTPLGRSN